MSSIVSVTGVIVNPIQRSEEGLGRFSVENEEGRFYIQTAWTAELANLNPSDRVEILGQLHSFHFSRCHCNHVYIEPISIQRAEQGQPIAYNLPR